MYTIRRITEENKSDIRLPNEPFKICLIRRKSYHRKNSMKCVSLILKMTMMK